jgi:hypothetical protein
MPIMIAMAPHTVPSTKLRLRWHSWAPLTVGLCKELPGMRLYRLFGSARRRDDTG